ncbi:unnamed protein product [Cochlearia groenlandica]
MPSRLILATDPSPSPAPSSHHVRTTRIYPPLAVAGAGAGFSLFITLSVCFCRFNRKRSSPPQSKNASFSHKKPQPPREFSYSTLRRATASFSPDNRLGQGGFGVVFRGTIASGEENIAVKVMDSGSLQGEAEFHNELFFAVKIDSPRVVPVIGFSHDPKRRRLLLVYKLMENGNLQDALIHRRCPELMDWNRRFTVAINIAEGIEHLHGLDPPVIHGDIKPSNVLLDHAFSAKIADFGLARLKSEQVEITIAPERDGGGGGGGGGAEEYVSVVEEVESVITDSTVYKDFNFGYIDQSPESVAKAYVSASPETGGGVALTSPETTTTTVVSVSPETEEKGKEIESNVVVERVKVKDYVLQWIGSEAIKKERPINSIDWIAKAGTTSSSSLSSKKLEKKTSKRLEWWLSLEEENEKQNNKKKKKKRRMVREWWKDEYHRDLDKQKPKKKKLESGFCSNDVSKWRRRGRSSSSSSNIDKWLDGLSGERWSKARGNSHDSVSGKSYGISSTPSMRGTVCYAAPEYCNLDNNNNNVSEKCDVYSYGVVLLVLVSGRRPLEMTGSANEIQRANLMLWARKLARRGRLVELVDQKLVNSDREQAVLCIKVALHCLQRLPLLRPSMKEVLRMLKGEVSLPELPNEFATTARKQRR